MAIDAELVEQIRRGNREAYGELFRKYYAQIYSLCLSILNNPQDAEEVAQEMFIHAYLKLDGLRKSDSFFPWLKKIAQNRSRDFVRQAERRRGPSSLPGRHTNTATPDDKLLRQELMDSIMEAIEALPAKDREVIQARIDGLDHAEISERFGISVEASMTRLSRARKKLSVQVMDLLHAIFGLSGMLPLTKLISGGIIAMKTGMSAKVTIGIIGVLAAGFVGFRTLTHQPDVESPGTTIQQQTEQAKVEPHSISRAKASTGESKKAMEDRKAPQEVTASLDELSESEESPEHDLSENQETPNADRELGKEEELLERYKKISETVEFSDLVDELDKNHSQFQELNRQMRECWDKIDESENARDELVNEQLSDEEYKRISDSFRSNEEKLRETCNEIGSVMKELREKSDDIMDRILKLLGMNIEEFVSVQRILLERGQSTPFQGSATNG